MRFLNWRTSKSMGAINVTASSGGVGASLRLPYGRRTGVPAVDRLSIVAHDRFQEIVDEASRPGSAVHLQQVILNPDQVAQQMKTVVSQSVLANELLIAPTQLTISTEVAGAEAAPAFRTGLEQAVAKLAFAEIRAYENRPALAPNVAQLRSNELQAQIAEKVKSHYQPAQLELEGTVEQPDIEAVVKQTIELVIQRTIDIPRIIVVPRGEVRYGFHAFALDLSGLHYQPPGEELWLQYLRTGGTESIGVLSEGSEEPRPENYIVAGLVDFDDISYDGTADLLYDLAGQVVARLRSYLADEDVAKVLRYHQRDIARLVHAQMQQHYWEEAAGYEAKVNKGFTELKASAYTASKTDPIRDFRQSPAGKSNMARYLFGGFQRCLYPVQKFHSNTERKLAVILDRESQKWFRPAKGQFLIYYRLGAEQREYQPDFVAETDDIIYMLEPKARGEMDDPEVLAKRDAATTWCRRASDHETDNGGKTWRYVLIPHDAIAENMTISGLALAWAVGH